MTTKTHNPLLHDPIPRVLARMTGPMVLGMLAILTFSLVDTFFIGLLGTEALAAVSFTFPVTFVVSSLIMGLGSGLSALLGHALGQGAQEQAQAITTDGVVLALGLVIALCGIGWHSIAPLFHALGAKDALIDLIHAYMEIWYLTVPLLVIPMVGNAALRATGDTKTPSIIMAISGLMNGLLDPMLIFGWGPVPAFGIKGAAIATGISWGFALVASVYFLHYREKLLQTRLSPWPQLRQHWHDLLTVALPAAFSNMLTPLANGLLLRLLAGLGTEIVAAYGAATRIEAILLLVMMSLASVLAPFIAQNRGAGLTERANQSLLLAMQFALCFQGILYGIIWLIAPWLSLQFSDHEAVQSWLEAYLHWVPIGYGCQGMVMLLASALNSIRAARLSLVINGLRLFGFFLPAAALGMSLNGAAGVYQGVLVAHLLCGSLAYSYAYYIFPRHSGSHLKLP